MKKTEVIYFRKLVGLRSRRSTALMGKIQETELTPFRAVDIYDCFDATLNSEHVNSTFANAATVAMATVSFLGRMKVMVLS